MSPCCHGLVIGIKRVRILQRKIDGAKLPILVDFDKKIIIKHNVEEIRYSKHFSMLKVCISLGLSAYIAKV